MSFCKGEEEHLPDILHRQKKVKRNEKCCCVIDLQTIAWQNNWWWKRKVPNNQVLQLYKRWNGYSRPAERLLYHHINVLLMSWVMVALSCILDTARVNGKTVWCLKKRFRYFKHIFIWLHLEFGESLGSSTSKTKKFEWLGI